MKGGSMFKILKPESHQEVLERIKKFIASKPDEEDSLSMIPVAAEKLDSEGLFKAIEQIKEKLGESLSEPEESDAREAVQEEISN